MHEPHILIADSELSDLKAAFYFKSTHHKKDSKNSLDIPMILRGDAIEFYSDLQDKYPLKMWQHNASSGHLEKIDSTAIETIERRAPVTLNTAYLEGLSASNQRKKPLPVDMDKRTSSELAVILCNETKPDGIPLDFGSIWTQQNQLSSFIGKLLSNNKKDDGVDGYYGDVMQTFPLHDLLGFIFFTTLISLNIRTYTIHSPLSSTQKLYDEINKKKPQLIVATEEVLNAMANFTKSQKDAIRAKNLKPHILVKHHTDYKNTQKQAEEVFGDGAKVLRVWGVDKLGAILAMEMEPGMGLIPLPGVKLAIAEETREGNDQIINIENINSPLNGQLLVSVDNISEHAKTSTKLDFTNSKQFVKTDFQCEIKKDGTISVVYKIYEVEECRITPADPADENSPVLHVNNTSKRKRTGENIIMKTSPSDMHHVTTGHCSASGSSK